MLLNRNLIMIVRIVLQGCLTDIALNTKGSPAILLLDMLKCVIFSPMAVIRSDRQELEAALRELAVVGCN